ncbi:MAG: homoserine kinase [Hyphomicrobiaceae bacterium]
MAVYTEVNDDDLAQFIASYGLGDLLSYKGIAEGVENTNYLVHASAGSYILTLYEKRVAHEDLPFFLGLMEHLASNGLSCPTPVRDNEGRMLRELSGRPAALITFLEGIWVRRPRAHHCAAVGECLARLHLIGRDFEMERANGLSLAGWRALQTSIGDAADQVMPNLGQLISSEMTALEDAWPDDLPKGVVHADFFPDNVFFLGEQISGVIDFYFACNDCFAYDLAICLNAWCFESDREFNLTKANALLRAYNSVRKLTKAEFEALPVLARGAALRFLLTRAYDWLHTSEDAFVKPHDPMAYIHRLRFHQSVRSAREYGLEEVV